ncbi:MAG: hypothetical protein AAGC86_04910 [Pseudomonadota bacterium]
MRAGQTNPDKQQMRDALDVVLSSATYANAYRFASFLAYIVEETLSARGSGICAKTIASDVYGRWP